VPKYGGKGVPNLEELVCQNWRKVRVKTSRKGQDSTANYVLHVGSDCEAVRGRK
jgi:hypothetical protein